MRIRARAASLCAAVVSVLALLPAGASAQLVPVEPADGPTQSYRVWPGTVASGTMHQGTPAAMVPEVISPGSCDLAEGSSRTFTFSYADQGVILQADGHFEEHGSFTIARAGGVLQVTDIDTTFSGSSPAGTIVGERHLRDTAERGVAHCFGTSEADRYFSVAVGRVTTDHRLTSASTGQVWEEHGFAFLNVVSNAGEGFGGYYSIFEHDQDDDDRSIMFDNCPDVPNPDQLDEDADGVGDACEGGRQSDADGDRVADVVDNCVFVANPTQANLDGDSVGDACDRDDDGDAVADGADNCPRIANAAQSDADADGVGDACETAAGTDGFAGGGGKLEGDVHVSVALHSKGGRLHGSGELADGATKVKLLDLTGLNSDGDRVVATGNASVDRGGSVDYRLEIVDSTNAFELEIGDRRWAGTLTSGNLVVK